MNAGFSAFDSPHHFGDFATRLLIRPVAHLPLSLVIAGPGLPPPRFAADTRPDAPSDASNYGF